MLKCVAMLLVPSTSSPLDLSPVRACALNPTEWCVAVSPVLQIVLTPNTRSTAPQAEVINLSSADDSHSYTARDMSKIIVHT